jgi:hypothetical protein
MLSAIPWIGKDLVEFNELGPLILCSSILPTIGSVNSKALRKARLLTEDEKREALKIPYSFLSKFIGLIDEVGYISITKTPAGYIRIRLIISLDIRDLR